ncbi:universal stress protein [Aquiflexum sp. LQ15W]|uniref:universal stress protein n=1 Tax=Cognataquiflexum nitidum TaxID=2922272 RepID=UPI001F12B65D|nr:universal stress protein [Cognataquiflexum nitidum]MCH6201857.1 universal stress protein [Cognataquiflexum nitidum]
MPKLYVLLDFSEYSKAELLLAKKMNEWYGHEIVVVHQMDLIVPSLANPDLRLKIIYEQQREISRQWFSLRDSVFDKFSMIKYEIIEDPLVEFLENNLDAAGLDIIMMGLKGSGNLKQIFLGSTVTKIIEHLNRIVIAVPKSLENFEPTKLLVSVHPNFEFNHGSFEVFLKYIPKSIHTIEFMTVARENDDIVEIEDFLKKLTIKEYGNLVNRFVLFKGEDVFSQIKTSITQNKEYFLVVQKGGRTFTDKLFRKFMVNELVFDGSIPMIVLPV